MKSIIIDLQNDIIDMKKWNNNIERSKIKTSQPKNMNSQHPQHVNVYSHQNVIRQSNQPRQKKNFSALDDF